MHDMRAFRLVGATRNDFAELEQIVGTPKAKQHAYISMVVLDDSFLVFTNCQAIASIYEDNGGQAVLIDYSNFDFMSV